MELMTIQERIDRHCEYIALFFPEVKTKIENNGVRVFDKEGLLIYRISFLVDVGFDRNERYLIDNLIEIENRLK